MADDREKLPRASVVGPAQGANSVMNQVEVQSTFPAVAAAHAEPADTEMTADRRPDNESEGGEQADFAYLPEHVWVKIMSYLQARDRVAVSLTGWTLNNVCISSSILWRSTTIRLENTNPGDVATLNAVERSVLLAHSHQINSAVIDVRSDGSLNVEESTYNSLCQVVQSWPLKRLEIRNYVKGEEGPSDLLLDNDQPDLFSSCLTSTSVSQLACLKLWGPAMISRHFVDMRVVTALQNAPFTSTLTHAHLGLAMSCLQCLTNIGRILGRFQNLQYLIVSYEYLTDVLLDNLPSGLKEIYFNVKPESLPITTHNWPQMLVKCSQLKIGLIFTGCPTFWSDTLGHILPHFVPVSSVKIQDVLPVQFIFHCHFLYCLPQSFAQLRVLQCDLSEVSLLGSALFTVAIRCPMLDHLSFSGLVTNFAVISLAIIRKWRVFEFDATSIVFDLLCNDREVALKALSVTVSKLLGRDWNFRRQKKSSTNTHLSCTGLHVQAGNLPPLTVADLHTSVS